GRPEERDINSYLAAPEQSRSAEDRRSRSTRFQSGLVCLHDESRRAWRDVLASGSANSPQPLAWNSLQSQRVEASVDDQSQAGGQPTARCYAQWHCGAKPFPPPAAVLQALSTPTAPLRDPRKANPERARLAPVDADREAAAHWLLPHGYVLP